MRSCPYSTSTAMKIDIFSAKRYLQYFCPIKTLAHMNHLHSSSRSADPDTIANTVLFSGHDAAKVSVSGSGHSSNMTQRWTKIEWSQWPQYSSKSFAFSINKNLITYWLSSWDHDVLEEGAVFGLRTQTSVCASLCTWPSWRLWTTGGGVP